MDSCSTNSPRRFNGFNLFWQTQAHRFSKELLIQEYPERFIASDFVDDVSVVELSRWLDLTFEEQKGLIWIDELRRKVKEPWYSKNWFYAHNAANQSSPSKNGRIFESVSNSFLGMTDRIKDDFESGTGLNRNIGVGLEKEQTLLIPVIRKLIACSEVFKSYVTQYELLKHQKITPSEFEKKLAKLPESSTVDGHFILEPVVTKQVHNSVFPFKLRFLH